MSAARRAGSASLLGTVHNVAPGMVTAWASAISVRVEGVVVVTDDKGGDFYGPPSVD